MTPTQQPNWPSYPLHFSCSRIGAKKPLYICKECQLPTNFRKQHTLGNNGQNHVKIQTRSIWRRELINLELGYRITIVIRSPVHYPLSAVAPRIYPASPRRRPADQLHKTHHCRSPQRPYVSTFKITPTSCVANRPLFVGEFVGLRGGLEAEIYFASAVNRYAGIEI